MTTTKKDKEGSSIFKLYFDLTNEYTEKFGENTVILLQVGSFYEMYGMRNENGTYSGSKIQEVANACHIAVRPKQLKYDNKDIVMAGFPDREIVLEKFLYYINEAGFTSVIWSQDNNDSTIRTFDHVVSPGTYFSNEEMKISNNICCIWFEITKQTKRKNPILYCGIANVNNITGDTTLYEYNITYNKSHTVYDELQRFISIKNPSEVIIISNFTNDEVNKIIQYSTINTNSVHIKNYKDKNIKKCTEQIYQYETFDKYFGSKIYQNDTSFMEKPIALQSLIYLIDFIHKHNPNLTKKINYPTFDNNSKDIMLANHTLQQLNIIPDNNYKGRMSSLLNLLNYCKSAIGKRKYEYEITHPTYDTNYLTREYNMTDYLLNNYNFIEFIRDNLNIHDLAYLIRKCIMKKVTPTDISFIYKSLKVTQQIYRHIKESDDFFEYIHEKISMNIENETKNIIDRLDFVYNIDLCETVDSYEIETNIFNKGYNEELDQLVEMHDILYDKMEKVRKKLDTLIKGQEKKPTSNEYVKIEITDKKGYCFQTTKTRSGKLKNSLSNENKFEIDETININNLSFLPANQNNVTIENDSINETFKIISKYKKNIKELVNNLHINFIDFFQEKQSKINTLIEFIEIIDNIQNKTYVAKKYNYSKPRLLSVLSSSSFISVKNLRHPLIENIHSEEYIPNDIELGRQKSGVLLYGTNAVGKTSLIRSIGMSVIMAQCGYYVPASDFEYTPYNKIFSRILNNDNLFKGLSTFAVEMSELNVILKECDQNSLILGDELCSGTEMDSAKAIFVSGLETIHNAKSSFMFATHLHEIAGYEEIENLDRLSMKHMTVHYDREKDKLIYDRILKDGPGESMYGLEVCKSLNMPQNFLEEAYNLRTKYLNTVSILDSKKSRYNSKKLLNMCEICGINPASETHHKKQQKDANMSGYIDNIHKDHISNLTAICEKCHLNEHKNHDKISNVII